MRRGHREAGRPRKVFAANQRVKVNLENLTIQAYRVILPTCVTYRIDRPRGDERRRKCRSSFRAVRATGRIAVNRYPNNHRHKSSEGYSRPKLRNEVTEGGPYAARTHPRSLRLAPDPGGAVPTGVEVASVVGLSYRATSASRQWRRYRRHLRTGDTLRWTRQQLAPRRRVGRCRRRTHGPRRRSQCPCPARGRERRLGCCRADCHQAPSRMAPLKARTSSSMCRDGLRR
jgi:hypothetical protein